MPIAPPLGYAAKGEDVRNPEELWNKPASTPVPEPAASSYVQSAPVAVGVWKIALGVCLGNLMAGTVGALLYALSKM